MMTGRICSCTSACSNATYRAVRTRKASRASTSLNDTKPQRGIRYQRVLPAIRLRKLVSFPPRRPLLVWRIQQINDRGHESSSKITLIHLLPLGTNVQAVIFSRESFFIGYTIWVATLVSKMVVCGCSFRFRQRLTCLCRKGPTPHPAKPANQSQARTPICSFLQHL